MNGIIVPGGFELHIDGEEVVWEYSNSAWSDKTYSTLCALTQAPTQVPPTQAPTASSTKATKAPKSKKSKKTKAPKKSKAPKTKRN
jgi:hypothetical protein